MQKEKTYIHLWTDKKTVNRFREMANFLGKTHHQLLNQALDALKESDPQLFQYFKEEKMKEDDTT